MTRQRRVPWPIIQGCSQCRLFTRPDTDQDDHHNGQQEQDGDDKRPLSGPRAAAWESKFHDASDDTYSHSRGDSPGETILKEDAGEDTPHRGPENAYGDRRLEPALRSQSFKESVVHSVTTRSDIGRRPFLQTIRLARAGTDVGVESGQ
jgi:hypothetical protein